MRVCLICEGCYPYIPGGVSSWIQMVCGQFPNVEFVIWSIATTREEMSEYKYKIPENIKEIKTIYLGDGEWTGSHRSIHLRPEEQNTLKKLVIETSADNIWKEILDFLQKYRHRLNDILMGEDFYYICLEEYQRQSSKKVFNHFLWNFRGMYLPLMFLLSAEIPKADIYHSVSTGYAGILGSCASHVEKKPFIVSEHGIYTREREEDIIRSNWVAGDFKNIWIAFFKKLSAIAYQKAAVVTSLFEVNRTLQIELGCPEEKIRIIPNGIDPKTFENLPVKHKLDQTKFQIGTVLRVVPIKDVKTMLLAFHSVKEKIADVQLNIMGNVEENREYYQECLDLVEDLEIQDVKFWGQVNIKEYLPEIKLLLLSSISEGQPLAILEGMAAGIPFVSTNVGHCKGLIEGDSEDNFGRAGVVVPIMDSEAMAEAIISIIQNPDERTQMGKAGLNRVTSRYQQKTFIEEYRKLYREMGGPKWQE